MNDNEMCRDDMEERQLQLEKNRLRQEMVSGEMSKVSV